MLGGFHGPEELARIVYRLTVLAMNLICGSGMLALVVAVRLHVLFALAGQRVTGTIQDRPLRMLLTLGKSMDISCMSAVRIDLQIENSRYRKNHTHVTFMTADSPSSRYRYTPPKMLPRTMVAAIVKRTRENTPERRIFFVRLTRTFHRITMGKTMTA